MLKRKLLTAGLLLAATTTASAIPYGFYDARSVAMGNVSVATGNLATAALSNPAMMSINESDDSFALLLPAIGLQAVDNGGMVDVLDEYQGLVDQFNATTNPTTQAALVTQLNALLPQFNGTNLAAQLSANAVLAYAGDDYAMAGFFRGTGQASLNVNTTASTVATTLPTGTLDAYGYATQEIGISFSTKFTVAGMKLAVGVTPKTVQVDSVSYSANVNIGDTADVLADAIETDLGSFSTVDAGVALQLNDSFTLGMVAKNLMEETLVSGTETFLFEKQLRAGVAYHNDFITIAADMDLTEIKGSRTTSTTLITEEGSKTAALGIEIDLGDIVQLRAGYQTNMANGATAPDLLSVGVGLWLGFHLDIAAVVGEDSSFGAFVQTGFRF